MITRVLTYIKRAVLLTLLTIPLSDLLGACELQSLFTQAKALLTSRQFDQAAASLDRAFACSPKSAVEMFELGWLYGRARQYQKALNAFSLVPRDVPDVATHDYAFALSHFELGHYQQAVDILRQDDISGAADTKAENLLAVSYSKLGLYTDAYTVLSRQLQRTPSDLTCHLNLITILAEGGNLPKAEEFAAASRQHFPASSDLPILQGAINEQLGHSSEALADFNAAATLDPSRADARFFAALVEYKTNHFSDALAILSAAIKYGIVDPDLHYLSAECLLKISPENSALAHAELDRAIKIDPDSVSARTLRGKLLLDAGRPAEALSDLEIAHDNDPSSRTALYNLARAYRATGDSIKAQTLFKQLRDDNLDTANEFTNLRLKKALSGDSPQ